MRDTLFIWVEAYEYPSGLRIEASFGVLLSFWGGS